MGCRWRGGGRRRHRQHCRVSALAGDHAQGAVSGPQRGTLFAHAAARAHGAAGALGNHHHGCRHPRFRHRRPDGGVAPEQAGAPGFPDGRWPAAVWQRGRRAVRRAGLSDRWPLFAAAFTRIDPRARDPVRPGDYPARPAGGKAVLRRALYPARAGRTIAVQRPVAGWLHSHRRRAACGTGAARTLLCRGAAFASGARQRWQARLRFPYRGIVARPGLAGARRHHLEAVDGARRLYLAHPALVSELLLPRRLWHALRSGVGLGRPALLLQPLGAGGECGQWRLADLARRHAASRHGHGAGLRRQTSCGHGGFRADDRPGRGSAVPGTGRRPATHLPGQGTQGHLRHALVCGGARGAGHCQLRL